jgi:hypothetical protein
LLHPDDADEMYGRFFPLPTSSLRHQSQTPAPASAGAASP